eukprot:CCRYP_000067-RB/>CCRYP_000067-RB protein AED:0.34 eAED:1.00 QI:0/0/0/1/0/0/2/0/310
MAAVALDTFRGSKTMATANPSGTLCTARLADMNTPRCCPCSPPKLTPMPTPSEKEWSVMTNTMRSSFLVSAPLSDPSLTLSSCRSRKFLVAEEGAEGGACRAGVGGAVVGVGEGASFEEEGVGCRHHHAGGYGVGESDVVFLHGGDEEEGEDAQSGGDGGDPSVVEDGVGRGRGGVVRGRAGEDGYEGEEEEDGVGSELGEGGFRRGGRRGGGVQRVLEDVRGAAAVVVVSVVVFFAGAAVAIVVVVAVVHVVAVNVVMLMVVALGSPRRRFRQHGGEGFERRRFVLWHGSTLTSSGHHCSRGWRLLAGD